MDGSAILAKNFDGSVNIAAMECAGTALRDARIRAGMELQDVSADLKISATYLQAIEDLDRNALPPRAYTLGFVRCYASYLGLNPQATADSFAAGDCTSTTGHKDVTLRPTPFWLDFSLPKGAGFAAAIFGIVGLAAWFGARTETVTRVVPPVPELLNAWSQSDSLTNMPSISEQPKIQSSIDPDGG